MHITSSRKNACVTIRASRLRSRVRPVALASCHTLTVAGSATACAARRVWAR